MDVWCGSECRVVGLWVDVTSRHRIMHVTSLFYSLFEHAASHWLAGHVYLRLVQQMARLCMWHARGTNATCMRYLELQERSIHAINMNWSPGWHNELFGVARVRHERPACVQCAGVCAVYLRAYAMQALCMQHPCRPRSGLAECT